MSVSRMAVSQGSVVATDSAAMTPTSTSGRRPRPCARSIKAATHTVRADCTSSTGQKLNGTPARSIRP